MGETDEEKAKRRGAIIRRIRKARGLTLEQVAELIGTKHGPLSQYERGERNPSLPMLEAIAGALGVEPGAFWADDSLDSTTPEPEHEGPSRQASESRSGAIRTFPMDSAVMRDGRVVGPITFDAIKDPTGKGGMVLRLGHSRRGHKKEVETREVPAVARDESVVFVRERVEIRAGHDVDEVLKPGLALIVSPSAKPEPGDLILVAKNIDWSVPVEGGSEEGLAGVTLMRYLAADVGGEQLLYGWPIDGDKSKRVQIDGPYSVVGVVVGRWSGRES